MKFSQLLLALVAASDLAVGGYIGRKKDGDMKKHGGFDIDRRDPPPPHADGDRFGRKKDGYHDVDRKKHGGFDMGREKHGGIDIDRRDPPPPPHADGNRPPPPRPDDDWDDDGRGRGDGDGPPPPPHLDDDDDGRDPPPPPDPNRGTAAAPVPPHLDQDHDGDIDDNYDRNGDGREDNAPPPPHLDQDRDGDIDDNVDRNGDGNTNSGAIGSTNNGQTAQGATTDPNANTGTSSGFQTNDVDDPNDGDGDGPDGNDLPNAAGSNSVPMMFSFAGLVAMGFAAMM